MQRVLLDMHFLSFWKKLLTQNFLELGKLCMPNLFRNMRPLA